jgi:hypothetical protein
VSLGCVAPGLHTSVAVVLNECCVTRGFRLNEVVGYDFSVELQRRWTLSATYSAGLRLNMRVLPRGGRGLHASVAPGLHTDISMRLFFDPQSVCSPGATLACLQYSLYCPTRPTSGRTTSKDFTPF